MRRSLGIVWRQQRMEAALEKLESLDRRKAEVVMLRYYAGLTIEETASALNVSPATVKNDWAFARAWLNRELTRDDDRDGSSKVRA